LLNQKKQQLSFSCGDIIIVHKKSPSGWWIGHLQKDEQKIAARFPSNFCKEITNEQIATSEDEKSSDDLSYSSRENSSHELLKKSNTSASELELIERAFSETQLQVEIKEKEEIIQVQVSGEIKIAEIEIEKITTTITENSSETNISNNLDSFLSDQKNPFATEVVGSDITISDSSSLTGSVHESESEPETKKKKGTNDEIMVALYDYNANGKEKLNFKEGDFIKVIKTRKSGWWIGELGGKTGKFPSNFCMRVSDLEENLKKEKEKGNEKENQLSDQKVKLNQSDEMEDLGSLKFDDEQEQPPPPSFGKDEYQSLSFQLQV